MKKIVLISLIFALILIPIISNGQSLNGQNTNKEYIQFTQSGYLISINDTAITENNPNDIEPEHPFRRFEITFFISAPFTFIVSYLTLYIFDVIRDSYIKKQYDGNVDVWGEYKYPLLIGTFGLSSAIALREAWICIKMNEKRTAESVNEPNISFYMTKYF